MAYYLAANPEWQDRCRDESDRLGDGPLDIEALEKLETLDLVINESMRLVAPVPWAMRQAVRDTELLGYYIPGHQRRRLPRHEPSAPRALDRPGEVRPGPLRRAAQRAQEAPLCVHAVRRRRAQVHRHGFGQLEVKTIMHRMLRKYRIELPGPDTQAKWDYGGMPVPMDGMPIVLRPLR